MTSKSDFILSLEFMRADTSGLDGPAVLRMTHQHQRREGGLISAMVAEMHLRSKLVRQKSKPTGNTSPPV